MVWVLVSGPLIAAPLFAFWFFSKGTWMGFGDVKFAHTMGWLLGPISGLQALLFSFILGAVISVPLLFFSSPTWERIRGRFTPTQTSRKSRVRFTMKSEVPFGPFLVAATLIIWILNMYDVTFIDMLAWEALLL
jgi:prepilin signal peptidase PulO-like enzyme (type II secretory pathway)